MKLAQTLLAGAVLSMAAMSAQAAVYNWGNHDVVKSQTVAIGKGATFTDHFTFSLTSKASVSGLVTSFDIPGFFNLTNAAVTLYKGTVDANGIKQAGYSVVGNFALADSAKTFANLGNGSYFYEVSARGDGFAGGAYTLASSMNVAPVPEPETYALMGLGLAGLLAARRRKAKQAA